MLRCATAGANSRGIAEWTFHTYTPRFYLLAEYCSCIRAFLPSSSPSLSPRASSAPPAPALDVKQIWTASIKGNYHKFWRRWRRIGGEICHVDGRTAADQDGVLAGARAVACVALARVFFAAEAEVARFHFNPEIFPLRDRAPARARVRTLNPQLRRDL